MSEPAKAWALCMKPTTSSRPQHRASASRTNDSSKYSATKTKSKTESNQARLHWMKDEDPRSKAAGLDVWLWPSAVVGAAWKRALGSRMWVREPVPEEQKAHSGDRKEKVTDKS